MIRVNETVVTEDSMTVGEFKKALEDIYHDYFPNSGIYLGVGGDRHEAELRVYLFLGTTEEQKFLGCDIFSITMFIQGLPRLVLSWDDTVTVDKPLRVIISNNNHILTTDLDGTDKRLLGETDFIKSDVSNLYENVSVQECLDIFEKYVHDIYKQTRKLVRRGYLDKLAKTGYKEPLDLDSKL